MIVWGLLPQKVPKYLRSAISHCTICAYGETTRLTPKREATGSNPFRRARKRAENLGNRVFPMRFRLFAFEGLFPARESCRPSFRLRFLSSEPLLLTAVWCPLPALLTDLLTGRFLLRFCEHAAAGENGEGLRKRCRHLSFPPCSRQTSE